MTFKQHCKDNELHDDDPITIDNIIKAAKLSLYIVNYYTIQLHKNYTNRIMQHIPMKFIEKFVIADLFRFYDDRLYINKNNLKNFIDTYNEKI